MQPAVYTLDRPHLYPSDKEETEGLIRVSGRKPGFFWMLLGTGFLHPPEGAYP